MLKTSGLTMKFGAFTVTDRVDFDLRAGARHALIGPNGAGKTTFVNLLTGALKPTSGAIAIDGVDVTGLSEAQRVKRGLGRTFQINRLFPALSALENVLLAVCEQQGIARRLWRPLARQAGEIDAARALLERLGLGEADALRRVSELSYGRQRLVEIAIALALRPRILLLDEPAAGVPKGESDVILDAIRALPQDIALLIIEHDMDIVFRLATEITVLVQGAILATGTPVQIAADPQVRDIYLGHGHG